MVCVGDAILSKRLSVFSDEEEFSSMVKMIRDADVSLVNLEGTIRDQEGYPQGDPKGDSYLQADPYMADELKWAGFDLGALANNHAMDYSIGGLLSTIKNLKRVGLKCAGAGTNLEEAREPAYLETKKGVVSLISTSTYPLGMAIHTRKGLKGRPGINPLLVETVYNLNSGDFKALKNVMNNLGLWPPDVPTIKTPEFEEGFIFPPREDKFRLMRDKFKLADETKVVQTINELDFKENIRAIEDARTLSDWVFFALHDHTSALKVPEGFKKAEISPKVIEEFAHTCIDAGADAFITHGPHVLRGVEIYKDKPIFHSLGNFVYQVPIKRQPSAIFQRWGLDTNAPAADLYLARTRTPAWLEPDWWRSVVAECTYEEKKLVKLNLFPITLGHDEESRSRRGMPRLAVGALGEKIIERLSLLSSRYGTEIEYKEGVASVKL